MRAHRGAVGAAECSAIAPSSDMAGVDAGHIHMGKGQREKSTARDAEGSTPADPSIGGIAKAFNAAAAPNATLLNLVVRQILVILLDKNIILELKLILSWILLCVLCFSVISLIFVINAIGAIIRNWTLDTDRYLISVVFVLLMVMLSTLWLARVSKSARALATIRRLEPVTKTRRLRNRATAAERAG